MPPPFTTVHLPPAPRPSARRAWCQKVADQLPEGALVCTDEGPSGQRWWVYHFSGPTIINAGDPKVCIIQDGGAREDFVEYGQTIELLMKPVHLFLFPDRSEG